MLTDEEFDRAEDILEHFGVKGMKWGQRSNRTPGVSRSTDRTAQKDAEEFARAKMYYGDGAGNRRKLINKSVEAKKKRDPEYAKAFEAHVSRQDLSTHATKAVKERDRTDRKARNKQRTGAIARRLTGEMGTQAAFVAIAAGGVAYMNSPRAQQIVKAEYKIAKNSAKRLVGARAIKKMLKNMT